ncbi:MAG: hypothetical protein LIP02_00140 [Bacteroidales bacterium]|nr:hypothetical protein [Bacteroidales bacterium]
MTTNDIFQAAFRAVEAVTRVTPDDLRSRRRDEPTAQARRLFIHVCRYVDIPYKSIAKAIDRKHPAVINAHQRLLELRRIYPSILAQVQRVAHEFLIIVSPRYQRALSQPTFADLLKMSPEDIAQFCEDNGITLRPKHNRQA